MTRQAFTPREYQQPVIDHILDVSRDAVPSCKTSTALSWGR